MKHPKQLVNDMISKNMPLIQVNLTNEENRQAELYKLHHGLKTKQEAIKEILVKGHKPLGVYKTK